MRFLGNIEAKPDVKGRVFLPAAFRKVLQAEGVEQLVMRKDVHEDCIVLYPESVWDERIDEMRAKLDKWNRVHRQIFRQYVSEVELVTLDGNGRFLLSKRWQDIAGIEQSVRFIGVDDTIEIWAVHEEDKPFMNAEEFSKALEEL